MVSESFLLVARIWKIGIRLAFDFLCFTLSFPSSAFGICLSIQLCCLLWYRPTQYAVAFSSSQPIASGRLALIWPLTCLAGLEQTEASHSAHSPFEFSARPYTRAYALHSLGSRESNVASCYPTFRATYPILYLHLSESWGPPQHGGLNAFLRLLAIREESLYFPKPSLFVVLVLWLHTLMKGLSL